MNVLEERIADSEVCEASPEDDVLFYDGRTMAEGELLCKKMGGRMTVVNDARLQQKLISVLRSTPNVTLDHCT